VKLRAAAASLALLGAVLGGACGDSHVHTFGAFPYDADHKCLDVGQTLDVIDGPDPGSCSKVRCWVNPAGEAFVTDKACDAPIDLTESSTGACEPALEAYKNHVMCADLDGGVGDS
jgi:hypothetical protein